MRKFIIISIFFAAKLNTYATARGLFYVNENLLDLTDLQFSLPVAGRLTSKTCPSRWLPATHGDFFNNIRTAKNETSGRLS